MHGRGKVLTRVTFEFLSAVVYGIYLYPKILQSWIKGLGLEEFFWSVPLPTRALLNFDHGYKNGKFHF